MTSSSLNLRSILGTQPSQGNSAYSVSKAGVLQLTKSAALELLPKGIRVNCLSPGYIETEMNQAYFASERGRRFVKDRLAGKALGKPSDLDGAMLLLASDESRFMTGSDIVVDGGSLLFSL